METVYQDSTDGLQQANSELMSTHKRIAELETELQSAAKGNQDHQYQLDKANRDIGNKDEQIAKLEKNLRDLISEKEFLVKTCDEKVTNIEVLDRRCTKLENEIDRLKKELFKAQEDQQRSDRKLKDLQSKRPSEVSRVDVKPTYETSFEVRRSRTQSENLSFKGRGRKTSSISMDVGGSKPVSPRSSPRSSPRLGRAPLSQRGFAPVHQSRRPGDSHTRPPSSNVSSKIQPEVTYEEPVIEVQVRPVEDEQPLQQQSDSKTGRKTPTGNSLARQSFSYEYNERTVSSVVSAHRVTEDLAYAEGTKPTPLSRNKTTDYNRNFYL